MTEPLSHHDPELRRVAGLRRSSAVRRNVAVLVACFGAFALVSACGGGDDLADKISEKVAESASDDDVDVDIDSDSGEVNIKSADGDESFSIGSDELPDGWPEDIPLPEDYTIAGSMGGSNAEEVTFTLTGSLDKGDAEDVFDDVTSQFVDDGWTEVQKSNSTNSGTATFNAIYENDELTVSFGVVDSDGEKSFSYFVGSANS